MTSIIAPRGYRRSLGFEIPASLVGTFNGEIASRAYSMAQLFNQVALDLGVPLSPRDRTAEDEAATERIYELLRIRDVDPARPALRYVVFQTPEPAPGPIEMDGEDQTPRVRALVGNDLFDNFPFLPFVDVLDGEARHQFRYAGFDLARGCAVYTPDGQLDTTTTARSKGRP